MFSYKVEIPQDAKPEERERLAVLNNEFSKETFWHIVDVCLLVLMVSLIIAGAIILGNATGADTKLTTWVEKNFYPLITLILGYITGKSVKGKART